MCADAAAILRDEIERLRDLGCADIQIDAPELGMLVDPGVRRHFESLGISVPRLLDEGVGLIDAITGGVAGVRFAVHLCRGNNAGRWMGSGGYQSIAKQVFPRLRHFHTYLLEFDGGRSGSFEPLRDVPDDKAVVLGLISTKRNDVESVETLIMRINEARQFCPLERLGISTQCGFASVVEGNPITEEAQEHKLRLVAEIAHGILR
jgi:5-methyltetrahydropteroyltriglutamate--homocysteine methyltransferase